MIWIMQVYIGDLKVVAIHALIITARNAVHTGPSLMVVHVCRRIQITTARKQ